MKISKIVLCFLFILSLSTTSTQAQEENVYVKFCRTDKVCEDKFCQGDQEILIGTLDILNKSLCKGKEYVPLTQYDRTLCKHKPNKPEYRSKCGSCTCLYEFLR